MYGITAKQKKALKFAVKQHCDTTHRFPTSAEDLPEFDAIGNMNPCEIYWQAANRFVQDLAYTPEFDYVFHRSTPF
jgi:hypothetical protein